jgi:hypothetical protein
LTRNPILIGPFAGVAEFAEAPAPAPAFFRAQPVVNAKTAESAKIQGSDLMIDESWANWLVVRAGNEFVGQSETG